jgi:indolepyruvate ferredoxin oxidoreductase
MAKARRWRGSWLNPWKNSEENKLDRQLLADHESDLHLIDGHSPNRELLALANWPAEVRGFGPIRSEAAAKVAGRREALRQLT